MAKHRTHSIEFKRQVSQEFLAGETLHGLSKRHDICRNEQRRSRAERIMMNRRESGGGSTS
jgi:transposase-like protein